MVDTILSFGVTTDIKQEVERSGTPAFTFEQPIIISGPCSVESEVQILATAQALAKIPEVTMLRGGIWKPRTRPDAFEGRGEVGLVWLREAKQESGLPTVTEVATWSWRFAPVNPTRVIFPEQADENNRITVDFSSGLAITRWLNAFASVVNIMTGH